MDAPAFFTSHGLTGRGDLAGFCDGGFASGGFVAGPFEIALNWFESCG
jgi:hypothetical protein